MHRSREAAQFHHGRRAVLFATAWNTNDWTMEALVNHYETLCRYMDWESAGMILATGWGTRSQCEASEFPEAAYRLGRTVRLS